MECRDKKLRNKRYNAYSVVATHGKRPRVAFAFARQPWAIKNTTRTELHDENIHGDRYIHWNISITPTALHHEGIYIAKYIYWNIGMTSTALRGENIHNGGCIHWNIGATPTALCIRIFVTANRLIRAIDVIED